MIKLIKKILDGNNDPKKNAADGDQQYTAEIDKLTADMEDIMDRRAILARKIVQLTGALEALLDKAEQLGDWNKQVIGDQYNKTDLELKNAKREFNQLGSELEMIRQQLAVYSAPIPKETVDPEVIQRVLDNIEIRNEEFLRKREEFKRIEGHLNDIYSSQSSAVSADVDAFSQALAEKKQKAETPKPLSAFEQALADRTAAKAAVPAAEMPAAVAEDDDDDDLPEPIASADAPGRNSVHYSDSYLLQKAADTIAAASKPAPLITDDMLPHKSVKYTEDYIHQKSSELAKTDTNTEGV